MTMRLFGRVSDELMTKNYDKLVSKLKRSSQWEIGLSEREFELHWQGLEIIRGQANKSGLLTDGWTLLEAPSWDSSPRVVDLTEAARVMRWNRWRGASSTNSATAWRGRITSWTCARNGFKEYQ